MTGTRDIDGQTADAQAVAQLVLRERQSRDRGWWDDMASCFTPGAVIDMSWFTGPASEFVRLTRERSANGVWGRHRLSPPAVRVISDRARAELPLGIEFRTTIDGIEADLVSYARSQYRAERRDGEWRIARITSIYERDTLTPATPGTALALDPAELTQFRPSYRSLAWYFNQAGTPLGGDLLGDDRPAEVAHHYETEHAWLLARLTSSRAMAAKQAQYLTPRWRPSRRQRHGATSSTRSTSGCARRLLSRSASPAWPASRGPPSTWSSAHGPDCSRRSGRICWSAAGSAARCGPRLTPTREPLRGGSAGSCR
jgi:hypothetical protein